MFEINTFVWAFLASSLALSFVQGNPVRQDNAGNEGFEEIGGDQDQGQVPNGLALPYPNGPFYGFPFDPATTWNRMLPFTVSGKCEAGKLYTIKKAEDILNLQAELECVYSSGSAPSRVPEGAMYGAVLSVINTQIFNQIAGHLWKGKMINKTECDGKTTYIGWNNIGGNPMGSFIARVGHHDLNLAPGESDSGRKMVVMEYKEDVTAACPEYRNHLMKNFGRVVARGASFGAAYPVNNAVDVMRLVGRQDDGADIYLGKTYLKDAYREDQQAVTVAYSVLISYDNDANPIAISGFPNVPLTESFRYMFPGILDLFFRLNPVDNLFTTPVRTISKMVKGAVNTGTRSFFHASSFPFGFMNLQQNSRRFQHRFYADARAARERLQNSKKEKPHQKLENELEVQTAF